MKNTSKNLLTAVFIVSISMLSFSSVLAQNGNVGIGTTDPDPNAILDLTSTNQGLLLPRLTQSQEDNLSGVPSLMIYNTNKAQFRYTALDGTWRALNPWLEYSSEDHVYYPHSATIGTLPSDFSHGLLVNSDDNKTVKLLSGGGSSGARMYFGDSEYVYIGEDNDDDLYFNADDGHHFMTGGGSDGNGTEKVTITSEGNVGIGTTLPTTGKLVVSGSASYDFPNGVAVGYLSPNIVGNSTTSNNISNCSIFADGGLIASRYDAISDRRIKKNIKLSDSKADLTTLKKIQVTNYNFIDSISEGNKDIKKVIAQQVREHLPNAVTLITNVIPDIYQLAELENGWIKLNTDLKKGERVQLIFGSEKSTIKVLEVRQGGFRVDIDRPEKNVFVYGREVNDFHTVDYESIAMLNVSATQELAKQVEQLQSEKHTQENRINELEQQLKELMQGFVELKSSLKETSEQERQSSRK